MRIPRNIWRRGQHILGAAEDSGHGELPQLISIDLRHVKFRYCRGKNHHYWESPDRFLEDAVSQIAVRHFSAFQPQVGPTKRPNDLVPHLDTRFGATQTCTQSCWNDVEANHLSKIPQNPIKLPWIFHEIPSNCRIHRPFVQPRMASLSPKLWVPSHQGTETPCHEKPTE